MTSAMLTLLLAEAYAATEAHLIAAGFTIGEPERPRVPETFTAAPHLALSASAARCLSIRNAPQGADA